MRRQKGVSQNLVCIWTWLLCISTCSHTPLAPRSILFLAVPTYIGRRCSQVYKAALAELLKAEELSKWNYRNKVYLLQAEKHSFMGRDEEARTSYGSAIIAARTSKSLYMNKDWHVSVLDFIAREWVIWSRRGGSSIRQGTATKNGGAR